MPASAVAVHLSRKKYWDDAPNLHICHRPSTERLQMWGEVRKEEKCSPPALPSTTHLRLPSTQLTPLPLALPFPTLELRRP